MQRQRDRRDMLVVAVSVAAAVIVIAVWWAGGLPILNDVVLWLADAGN